MIVWLDFADKGKPCTAGKGECKATGKQQCKADGSGVECSVKAAASSKEVCDGKDNNCDGFTDEGFDVDLDGVADPLAAEAFERAAMKLPIKTKVVARLGDESHLKG